ncbi:glycosyltransferase family 4 protein [Ghiorsea bivora]|uniref:glycosyltransferase family 4 protein n=1 Tax=Ghiorsea bivora TaxID=1485545 RepID=UPI0012FD8FC2|nr:glycosyltransferase family 4 protein [Ghiorsea bivora]
MKKVSKRALPPFRVLMVADVSAETVFGGAERMLSHHLRALVDAGYEVTMLTRQPSPDAEVCIELSQFGIQEFRFPFSGDKGYQGLKELKLAAKQWWKHHHDEFDVVVSEQPFVMWALLEAGCKLPRLQVCHSLACEEYETRHALDMNMKHRVAIAAMRKLETKVYRSAQQVMVLSQYTQHKLQRFFGLDARRFVVNAGAAEPYQGLDIAQRDVLRAELGWDTPVVSTLRNLVPRTGVDLMIQAAAIVKNRRQDIRFVVMGDGVLRGSMQKLADDLGVADMVEFTGFLSEEAVQKRLLASDVFMVPTRGLEGFGLVTLEANAWGTPVLATPIAANKELVPTIMHNQLADNASPLALAEKLLWMLDNDLNDKQRMRTREDVLHQYNWQKHDAQLLHSIEALGKV